MGFRNFALVAGCATVLFAGCAGDVAGPTSHEKLGSTRQALTQSFAAGSFIIPMGNNHQDAGMIRANGLVYALLRENVPVHWAVLPGKAAGANDFTINASATIVDRETGANIATPQSYPGGPFVVSAADRTAALPVITTWLAADTVTVVHELTSGTFTADIAKTLTAAPSIAVFEDGAEAIAYANLDAAGIRDSAGNTWSHLSPGSLSAALMIGTDPNNADGALFNTTFPAYSFLLSEHYGAPNAEVIAEVRSWLDTGPHVHAFMQCAGITSFENFAPDAANPGGHFLTTAGFITTGGRPSPLTSRFPSNPIAQFDGAILADSGQTDSLSLAPTSVFRANVRTLLNESDEPSDQEIMLLTGVLDGNMQKGRVTYLTGHDYSLISPVSTNPLTNGTRIIFNSIFDSPSALTPSQPAMTITKAAPATTNESLVTFTINYTNTGAAPAYDVVITDPVPKGSTFASATNAGTVAAGMVTWRIGLVAPGASASVILSVNVTADATLTNQATLGFRAWQTHRTALSNTTSTIRDATPPTTTIVSGPPATGTSTTANFDFSSNDPTATFECSLDLAPAFTACTDPTTFNVGEGPHTLDVRARDPLGNVDETPERHTWTVTSSVPGGDVDTDGDGLTDAVERKIGTDPNDADSDDDGVIDGQEKDFDKDTDGDGLINALDPDSDNDGLFDGTELGLGCGLPATNLAAKRCVPDADNGATTTDPLNKDTDNGGASDGSEDANLNGRLDPGETDPTAGHGADDATVIDSDGDGLSDAVEVTLGSNPNDADTDDDGVRDGNEANPSDDTDGDGKRNVVDSDSDGDGLFDGTESGLGCADPSTDVAKGMCIADADQGATKTSPVDPDTDHGGVKDGEEDTNKNGMLDPGERNPNNRLDDAEPTSLEGGGFNCAFAGRPTDASHGWPAALATILAIAVTGARRRRKRALHLSTAILSSAVVSAIALTAREASAQGTGFALNRYDPSERGSEWFALESLDLRGHARPAAGLVMDWSHRPLALYRRDGSLDKAVVEDQVFLHAGGTIVLWDRLRLGVNAPVAIYQQGDQGTFVTPTSTTTFAPPDGAALADIRLGGDVRLVGAYGDKFTLAFGTHVYLPAGSRASYTGDETLRVQPRVVAAGDVGGLAYSARIAVQYRPDDRVVAASKLGSQVLFAAAAGLRLADGKLVIGPELYGSTVFGESFERLSSPLEGILGAHYTAGDVRFGLGGGAGMTRGFGSPVGRMLASIEWAPQPKKDADRDKDGILDKDDACPDVPGIKTDDPKTNGCPAEKDRDHDGILDKDDACPDVPGIKTDDPTTNGCPPDRDHDGIADSDDACPDVPGIKTDDPKTNGCPPDRDHDGILDKDDACPDVPGIKTDDPKTNGCPPDPDRDHDGIPNEVDACPDEPGTKDPDPAKNGCPKAFIRGGQIKILDQVKFAFASAQIVEAKDSQEVLEAVLKVLTEHPEIKKLRVEGHTDNKGAVELNRKLSAARAASVVKWLTAKGIDGSRLNSAGFGSERSIDTNDTDAGRQNNRRVEFHIEGEPGESEGHSPIA